MSSDIKNTVSSGQENHEADIRFLKTALNRLGFYMPDSDKGVTGKAEPTFFEAIEDFQRQHNLFVDGQVLPDDKMIKTLNLELKNPDNYMLFRGAYIWRSVGDDKVRGVHKARDGQPFRWDTPPEGGHPGEDYGCRCWSEPIVPMPPRGVNLGFIGRISDDPVKNVMHGVAKVNCNEKRKKYEESKKRVKGLTEKLHDLLLELNDLRQENNELIRNARKSLGARLVTYILALPFERLGVLGDLLQRHFDSIISDELMEGADNFMRQVWSVRQKMQYVQDQSAIILSMLEKSAKEFEESKKRKEECEVHEKENQ